MLQIIGFLGCVMLAVKLLEMAANSALRTDDGDMKSTAAAALWLGWLSVFGFAFWLVEQGQMFPDYASNQAPDITLTQEQIDCITNAKTNEAILACSP